MKFLEYVYTSTQTHTYIHVVCNRDESRYLCRYIFDKMRAWRGRHMLTHISHATLYIIYLYMSMMFERQRNVYKLFKFQFSCVQSMLFLLDRSFAWLQKKSNETSIDHIRTHTICYININIIIYTICICYGKKRFGIIT